MKYAGQLERMGKMSQPQRILGERPARKKQIKDLAVYWEIILK